MNEFGYDVFLSHSGEDREDAKFLKDSLTEFAINTYYWGDEDPDDTQSVRDHLATALSQTMTLLIYLSDTLFSSRRWAPEYEIRTFLNNLNATGLKNRRVIFFSRANNKGDLKKDLLEKFHEFQDLLKPEGIVFDNPGRIVQYIKSTVGLKDLRPVDNSWLRIGVGCCVWAAPIIRTLFDNRNNLEKCCLTLYGFQANDGPKINFWYQKENYEVPYAIPFDGDTDGTAEIVKWEKSAINRARLYNASDLLDQVSRDKLDCIIVPSEVYELEKINQDLLVKVASIMHTFQGGCKLLILSREETIMNSFRELNLDQCSDKRSFWRALGKECANWNMDKIKVLLNKKTVLEKYYNEHEKDGLTGICETSDISLGDWKALIKKLELSFDKEKGKIFLLLAWEPQVRWIKNHLKGKYPDPIELDFLMTFKDFSLPYLSFDIMLSRRSWAKWRAHEGQLKPNLVALQTFFTTIESSIEDFNIEKRDIRDEAKKLSSFMWMERKECAKVLQELNFKFMVYWKWMIEIEKMLSSGKVVLQD
jgi:hypothetical protein